MDLGIALLIIFAVGIFFYFMVRKARFNSLVARFGSEECASRIMKGVVWQGMTDEMLTEAQGKPDDIDRSVFKQKTKETWKYGKIGKNRYKKRIMLENGIVVGWR